MNVIRIKGLEVTTRVGVPDAERSQEQVLRVDLEIVPSCDFSEMGDEIAATVDYHAVCLEIAELAAKGERLLIETLAEEIVDHVLENHPAKKVAVDIRKFVLPQTEWVGVGVSRSAKLASGGTLQKGD